MARPVKKRSYDTASRQARSAETRQRIVDAARHLIVEQGYRATTIAAVAAAADVSVDTIYTLIGRKPVLVAELVEQAISGTDHAVVALEREQIVAVRAEPDPARKLERYAGVITDVHGRLAPLFVALRDASATESEAREVWQTINERRATNMIAFAGELRDAGGLRDDLSVRDAADIIWTTASPEIYLLFTVDRQWSAQRFERWLADTWHRTLLT